MATPRSSGGSRKRTYLHSREVDAIKNPTKLFQKINSGDWDGALDALYDRSADASVWISGQTRDGQNSADIAWKYLPLHLICMQKRPPLNLLKELLRVFPSAAAMSTPHDGNLAIHYACESGCDSSELLWEVLACLLEAYPASLEVKNFKDRSPLLLCNGKTRQVLMGVVRTRKQAAAGKKNKYEHRNDEAGSTGRDKKFYHKERRQPPPLNAHLLPPLIDDDESVNYEDDAEDMSEQDLAWQTGQLPASYRVKSNKTSVTSRSSREDELREQVESLADQSKSQQKVIAKLNERLHQLTHQDEDTVAEDAKLLCQRILSKAEADSVKFRTQIQQLQAENEQMKQEAAKQDELVLKTLVDIRDALWHKGDQLNLNLFNDNSDSADSKTNEAPTKCIKLSGQIVVALGAVFSRMESNEEKLRSQTKSLEEQVSNSEVQIKSAQSVNQNLRLEKEALIKKQRDLENKISDLRDEKEAVEQSLADAKEKNSTLAVTNKSLQEQIRTPVEDGYVRQHFQFSDVDSLHGGLQSCQHTIDENEAKIASLLKDQELLKEKNRSLKDTILMNNEKYFNKVQELGEKYSELEKVNADLRKKVASLSVNDKTRSSLKVSLEGEDELLYEV